MLVLENVSRYVPMGRNYERCLFDELTLQFRSGELTALVGRSGLGKSSVLEIAALERRPDNGQVFFQGMSASFNNSDRIAELKATEVSYVRQSADLFKGSTTAENIQVGMDFAGVPIATQEAICAETCKQLDISHLMDQVVVGLSGGEQQRVCLARALSRSTPFLICDEPTAALDAGTTANVIEALHAAAERGGTVVVATHDPLLIAASDHVINLEELSR